MSSFLVTFIGGDYKVVSENKAAAISSHPDVLDVQAIPQQPEDWHEIEEQYLHTLG
jgi:hypothetical protein